MSTLNGISWNVLDYEGVLGKGRQRARRIDYKKRELLKKKERCHVPDTRSFNVNRPYITLIIHANMSILSNSAFIYLCSQIVYV